MTGSAGVKSPNGSIQAYNHSWEQIQEELKLLDLRIRLQFKQQRADEEQERRNQLKGLIISDSEIEALLEQEEQEQKSSESKQLWEEIQELEQFLYSRTRVTVEQGIFLHLEHLVWAFGLDLFARNCLLLCLAVEWDRKYEKIFAYLQDDVTCKYPTIDLALKLLCRSKEENIMARGAFALDSPLMKYLLHSADEGQTAGSRLSRPLKLERRFLDYFFQTLTLDTAIEDWTEFINPYDPIEPLLLNIDIQEEMRAWWQRVLAEENALKPLFVIHGPSGSGKRLQVRRLCSYYACPLLMIDLAKMPLDKDGFARGLHNILRECLLTGALACIRGLETIMPDSFENHKAPGSSAPDGRRGILLGILEELPGPLFILAEKPLGRMELGPDYSVFTIGLDIPGEIVRKEIWEQFSAGYKFAAPVDWGQMASKFRFTAGQIRDALQEAREITYSDRELKPGISLETLHRACFDQGRHVLGRTAARIKPVYCWEHLILPPDTIELLNNACNQMKNRYIVYGQWGFEQRLAYGKGLSLLFSGLPGTGKTMAAQVIARELNLELYRIDLAQIVSKYIGETEKNLRQIFSEAQSSNAILFFDEADALFGKRSEVKDSHDRYANIEIAYLLQKVEEYEGISILATNLAKNMDEAFVRRITFIVEFPFPDAQYRKKIWLSMFPQQTPLHKDVDFDFLANRFEIAGGSIKNIVLAAAFLAAQESDEVRMKHILRATKYEFKKTGRVLLKEDLGEYYEEI